MPAGAIDAPSRSRGVFARLPRACYEEFYGYRLDGIPIELVRLHGRRGARASLPSLRLDERRRGRRRARPSRAATSTSPATGFVPTPVVRREELAAGDASATGPLIVESMDSTVVVPPGWSLARRATAACSSSCDEEA